MPETCENGLSFVNSYVYYACQTQWGTALLSAFTE